MSSHILYWCFVSPIDGTARYYISVVDMNTLDCAILPSLHSFLSSLLMPEDSNPGHLAWPTTALTTRPLSLGCLDSTIFISPLKWAHRYFANFRNFLASLLKSFALKESLRQPRRIN